MTISVIITTYNRAHLLPQTVESALAQTRPADEVVIIDDGSTDTTPEVATSFGERGVRYIRQENAYLSAARNTGFANTTGETVLFLDDDDLLLPDALRQLEAALISHPDASLSYCRARTIDPHGKTLDPLWTVGNEAEKDLLWEALARMNFIRSPGCVLVRREALEGVVGGRWSVASEAGSGVRGLGSGRDEDQVPFSQHSTLNTQDSPSDHRPLPTDHQLFDCQFRACEDWDMWLRLASRERAEFVRVPEVLFAYRIQPDSMSASKELMYRAAQAVYRKHLAFYARGSSRYEQLSALLAEFPPLPEDQEQVLQAMTDAPKARELSLKHRLLRAILEYSGIAPLYRRLPIGVRLRMRSAFGIKRWAG